MALGAAEGSAMVARSDGDRAIPASLRWEGSHWRVMIVGADPLFVEAVTPNLEALGMTVIQPSSPGARGGVPDGVVVVVDRDGDPDRATSPAPGDLPHSRHVLMSSGLDHAGVRDALRQGYRGAISKDIPLHRFGSAILSVAQGDLVMEPGSHRRRSREHDDISSVVAASLTAREREVLALLVGGATGVEISERLTLSPHTVRTHVQNLMSKLQVHTRLEAVAYAVRHQLVTLKDSVAGTDEGRPTSR